MNSTVRSRALQGACVLLCWVLLAVCAWPAVAYADDAKIVRVGWYESPFNTTDDLGRRSGYAYDYEQRVAAYTGWTYEYVEGSWPELLQMLIDGRIDLLSDVSFTEEREGKMIFSSLPMGAEEYYLFAGPENQEITADDYATFNGKKVGVNKGSVQVDLFRAWAKGNGVTAEIVELTGQEEENLAKLKRGDIDLYLSLGGFFEDAVLPVARVGASDFYFVVNKSHPELMADLNGAMNRIVSEDPYYSDKLSAKYLNSSSMNNYLNTAELAWVEDHDTIRVGYQDNYMAFCAQDPETGELTGALKDYLAYASTCMENATLEFEPICYPTSADAMDALKRGEVDCMFPANFTPYDGEGLGVYVTPPLMTTDMAAVIRRADQRDFAKKERVTVAVNADNPNYDVFLEDNFPEWRAIYFSDTSECLKAVAEGQADCLLISSYRYNDIARQCEKYDLTTWSTGVELDYCFAVNRGDTVFYSILAKVAGAVPASTVHAALTYYFTEDAKYGVSDYLRQNRWSIVLSVLALAVLVFSLVLLYRVRKREWALHNRKQVPMAEDFAFLDDLPVSFSVYRVTHVEHSELYDAEIVYLNRAFEQTGKLPAASAIGHHVRELFPYVEEEWFQTARRAALDGETVQYEYVDPLKGTTFRLTAWQVKMPGYCAVTYQEL